MTAMAGVKPMSDAELMAEYEQQRRLLELGNGDAVMVSVLQELIEFRAERDHLQWQRDAFHSTVELAESRGMVGFDASTDMAHLKDMQGRLADEYGPGKLGRWLGWAQCSVVVGGAAVLDDVKRINKGHSEARRNRIG